MSTQGTNRVVVVGGTGFLGSRAVAALRRVEGVDVVVASRRSEVRVDLSDPTTFGALHGAALVIDLADATSTPPDELAKWCLSNGVRLLETTSDFSAIERLCKVDTKGATGTLILGAGIFTGLSNLLAREAIRKVDEPTSVSLAIRSSPYSGAGTGTVALMAAILSVSGASFRNGKRVSHPPVERGPNVRFTAGTAPSLRIPLAEVLMLSASTGASGIDAYFSPKPSLLVWAFLAMPGFVLKSALFAAFMRAYFGFLRRYILKNVVTTTELHAEAEGKSGKRATLDLSARDGMTTGGVAIAAMAAELLEQERIASGLLMIDDLLELEVVLTRMRPCVRAAKSSKR